jgi:hypothetical protein
MPGRTKVLVSSGVAIAILAFYPRQETVAPDWHINVTDDSGRPLIGIKITEVWQDYTVERNSHEDSQVTDADGHLVFIGTLCGYRLSGAFAERLAILCPRERTRVLARLLIWLSLTPPDTATTTPTNSGTMMHAGSVATRRLTKRLSFIAARMASVAWFVCNRAN